MNQHGCVLHLHISINCRGCWGTTDNFAINFCNSSLFSTSLWTMANSRPVHSLMWSSHLFFHPPCLLPPALSSSPFHCDLKDCFGQTCMAVSLGAQIQSRKVLLLHKWWCLPRCEDFGGWLSNAFPACAFFFLKVEISSRTLILLLTPGSVHSGSVSSDDCGQVFPD